MVATKEKQAVEFENSVADRDRIIAKHMGLIKSIAKGKKVEGQECRAFDHEDLYQDAIVEICKKYDAFAKKREMDSPSASGYESMFVAFCAKSGIRRSRLMRSVGSISNETLFYYKKYVAAVKKLEDAGEDVTDEKLSRIIGRSLESVKRLACAVAFSESPAHQLDWSFPKNGKSHESQVDNGDLCEHVRSVARSIMKDKEYETWEKYCVSSKSRGGGKRPMKKLRGLNERLKAELEARGEFHCG